MGSLSLACHGSFSFYFGIGFKRMEEVLQPVHLNLAVSPGEKKDLERAYFLMRFQSRRWILGSSVNLKSTFPHEQTFYQKVRKKIFYFQKEKQNPWPLHLAVAENPLNWSSGWEQWLRNKECTLVHQSADSQIWRLHELPKWMRKFDKFLVLDGHHSRKAQSLMEHTHSFCWIECLQERALSMKPILRLGLFQAWIDWAMRCEWLTPMAVQEKKGSSGFFMGFHSIFEENDKYFLFTHRAVTFFKEQKKQAYGITSVDLFHELWKVWKKQESQDSTTIEYAVDYPEHSKSHIFVFPRCSKKFIYQRALRRFLFPQKTTCFFPKILIPGLAASF